MMSTFHNVLYLKDKRCFQCYYNKDKHISLTYIHIYIYIRNCSKDVDYFIIKIIILLLSICLYIKKNYKIK